MEMEEDLHIINVDESKNGPTTSKNDTIKWRKKESPCSYFSLFFIWLNLGILPWL